MRQKVLAIDDDPTTLELIRCCLEDVYEVETLTSAKSCVQAVTQLDPNLILLDLSMPDIDGFTVCDLLKDNVKTKHIPIIILTAQEETCHRIKSYNRGAVDYITKPINPSELLKKSNSVLNTSC